MGLHTYDVFSILKLFQKDDTNKSLCMMGKQGLAIDWPALSRLVTQYGLYYNEEEFEKNKREEEIDSFDFFKIFGFSEVHAVDISPYEGADIIYDLNKELPSDLYQKFDCIVDGGTLEHIFDPAAAIKNMANMVKEGGYIVHINPVAGGVDHGFYSFSPYMYSAFYQANGFELKKLELLFKKYDDKAKSNRNFATSMDCRMIPDINKLIFDMQKAAGDKPMSTQIWCSARKKDNTAAGVHPIQEFEVPGDKVGPDWKENVIRFLQENQNKEIVLYGKGNFCDQLLDELFRNDLENCIKYIFDSSPRKAGNMHRGYKVVCPTKAKLEKADIILISNVRYARDIYSILLNFGAEIASKVYRLSQF